MVVLLLSLVYSSLEKGIEKALQKVGQTERVKEFVSLHPSVIIRHPWNKEM
jgi:hypothetical protein